MRLQQVLSYVRRAVDDYHMIEEGDKIAVGISGGKDSLTLLYALHGLKRFYPKHFELHAVTVDLGFHNLDLGRIEKLCGEELHIPYSIIKTDIADIIFNQRKETNPCSLCAKMRKGALNDAVKREGCNKAVSYTHLDVYKRQGAAFGMMQGGKVFFLIITPIVLAAILYTLIRMPAESKYNCIRILLSCIAVGAIGNMIDRIRLDYVVDLIYISLIDFCLLYTSSCV